MEDNASEQDRGQDGHSPAPVSRRSFVAGVAAAGAAATAARALPGRVAVSGVSGARAGRAAAATCGSLSLVGPPVSGGELTDAAFVSAGEWWAVGNVGSALHANRTLIVRFDGSAWSAVPSPNQGTLNNGLNGVSMIGGGGWAVGFYQAGGYQPLALQWDGTQWSLHLPATFPSDSVFTGVDALADGTAWAVGFQTTKTGTRSTLIEQESGGAWTQVASPNVAGSTDNSLMAVSGTLATGLWAVGYWLSPTGLQPLVLRYDTTLPSPSWVLVGGVPSPGQVDTVLTGVDVRTASDVWAVGYRNDGGADLPLALHWDGTWPVLPSPGAAAAPGQGGRPATRAAGAHYNAASGATRRWWCILTGRHGQRRSRPTPNRPATRLSDLRSTRRGRRSRWWAGRARTRSSNRRTAPRDRYRCRPGRLRRFLRCLPRRASARRRARRRARPRRCPRSR